MVNITKSSYSKMHNNNYGCLVAVFCRLHAADWWPSTSVFLDDSGRIQSDSTATAGGTSKPTERWKTSD